MDFNGGMYSVIDDAHKYFQQKIKDIDERIILLRGNGTLTSETIERYYGSTKWEQIAESNAIEGSTLNAGETELAVISGVTLSGHDPGFVRDAISLHRATQAMVELARNPTKTDLQEILAIHALILEGRPSAGKVREEEIRITGTEHRPPKYYGEIIEMLNDLENWSKDERNSHPIIRSAIIHAWIVHIHPFLDGNGRTARAIGNLQLIRGGLPPIIIKKVERKNYLEGIRHSDYAGDIGPFLDYVIHKTQGALTGLENAARERQGYSPIAAKLRNKQKDLLRVWNTSVQLLREMLFRELEELSADGLEFKLTDIQPEIDLDDYIALASRDPSGNSQLFRIQISIPSIGINNDYLFWVGYRSLQFEHPEVDQQIGPSIFVSIRSNGYPPWVLDDMVKIGFKEATIKPGYGDLWFVRGPDSMVRRKSMTQFVKDIVGKLIS